MAEEKPYHRRCTGVGLFAALFTKFTAQRQYTASHQIIFKGESSGGMSSALRLASSLGLGGGIGGRCINVMIG